MANRARGVSSRSRDAAEPEVGGGGVDGFGRSCRRAVAPAEVGRAEMGPPLHHLAEDAVLRHRRCWPRDHRARERPRCSRRWRSHRGPGTSPRSIPTRCPSSRTGRTHSAGTSAPVPCSRSRRPRRCGQGNSPCHTFAMCRPPSASPHAYSALSRPPRAARSHAASLGNSLARGIHLDVSPRHVQHRVLVEPLQRALRTTGVAPRCPGHCEPPLVGIVQGDRALGLAEHRRSRHQQRRVGSGIHGGVRCLLHDRRVPGGLDEPAELGVGHRAPVHPETLDGHRMRRSLLRIVLVGPHQERPTRDPHHAHVRGRTPGPARAGAHDRHDLPGVPRRHHPSWVRGTVGGPARRLRSVGTNDLEACVSTSTNTVRRLVDEGSSRSFPTRGRAS